MNEHIHMHCSHNCIHTRTHVYTHTHRSDCEHFGLLPPELPLLEELQTDLTQYEGMWSLYGEFSCGMDQLRREDWISFRYGTVINEDQGTREVVHVFYGEVE